MWESEKWMKGRYFYLSRWSNDVHLPKLIHLPKVLILLLEGTRVPSVNGSKSEVQARARGLGTVQARARGL